MAIGQGTRPTRLLQADTADGHEADVAPVPGTWEARLNEINAAFGDANSHSEHDRGDSPEYDPSEGQVEQQDAMVVAADDSSEAPAAGVVSVEVYRAIVAGKHMVFSSSQLGQVINATMPAALQRSATNYFDDLGKEMLLNKQHRVSTLVELADKVNINRRHLPQDLVTLAAATLECQQWQRHQLEVSVVKAVGDKHDLLL